MLLNIIVWIVLGGIAGWLASLIMGKDASMGTIANIVVGIVGALIGGFLMNLFGASGATGLNLYSLLVAILGAVVLLFLLGVFVGSLMLGAKGMGEFAEYSGLRRKALRNPSE
jgi:uncharacterized membrane protein YeaQ/YmgE (transglycosylase-associated protein family)